MLNVSTTVEDTGVSENYHDYINDKLVLKSLVLEDFSSIDQDNLAKLSEVFGVDWTYKIEDQSNYHPNISTVILGAIGNKTNIMYESWLVGNKFIPQRSINYNRGGLWYRVDVEDALNDDDLGWRQFLTELYLESDFENLSADVAIKLQKSILERL